MAIQGEEPARLRGHRAPDRRRPRLYMLTMLLALASVAMGVICLIETLRSVRRLRVNVPYVARYLGPILSAFRSVTLSVGLLVTFLFVALGCALWLLRRTVRHVETLAQRPDAAGRRWAELSRHLNDL